MGEAASGRARRSRRGTPPAWAVRRTARARTANPQATGALETLDHRGQVLPALETLVENPMGRGAKGDRER